MPERREGLRPDLERLNSVFPEAVTFSHKDEMVRQVINNIKTQGHTLRGTDAQLSALAYSCISEIEHLHNVGDIILDPPKDVDVIWIVSAPGLLLEHGSKPGWSVNYPQLDDCEWEVVGAGFALAETVTAKRLNKNVNEISRQDIRNYGPWIVYNVNPWENEAIETILEESYALPIPREKVHIYIPEGAEDPTYIRTVDQARDLRMPLGISPRVLAVSVLAAQCARLGRILAITQSLPKHSDLLVVPTRSPKGFEEQHAIMETQGALINAYKNHVGALAPVRYRV